MKEISRKSLFARLNSVSFKSLESATVLCKLRGNPYVELVHWISHLLELDDSDWHHIIRYFEIDQQQVIIQINRALEELPTGANGIRDLSSNLMTVTEKAWLYGSLMFHREHIRTADLLIALLKTPTLERMFQKICPALAHIDSKVLCDSLNEIVKNSVETSLVASSTNSEPGEESMARAPGELGGDDAIKRYTVNLTALAKSGGIDPVTGRDAEIRQMVDILLRRRQNNPLITGEAGVGKTAIVEGFAQMIVNKEVPPALQDAQVLTLDLGLLKAGASMKGEFEQRLRQVIDQVQGSENQLILFIDEIHTLIGAGGAAGTGDAANLLKPALARGQLRTIGATTWSEYKKHIEKDPALTRRFQVIQVAEPSEEQAINMLSRLSQSMESHHQVNVLNEAVQAAVRLSHRYIPARQLPDKAIAVLDTACARVAVTQHSVPAQLQDKKSLLNAKQSQFKQLEAESAQGIDHQLALTACSAEVAELKVQITGIEERWQKEKDLCKQISEIRTGLRNQPKEQKQAERLKNIEVLKQLETELDALQNNKPLIYTQVNADAVAAVIAEWTGIPVGRMLKDEVSQVLTLEKALANRILGQDHALHAIAQQIQVSRARLDDPNKPVGVFMLAGTSGVGKTETALALAETLYGGEHNLITINMSEYQESHTVSTLKGSPPGYVGYGEGGVLTEAVRRRPYSVVLLDEVEKAHPDVHELFFQVFDKGWMEDGEGRRIDFKNTLILLTTNVGTQEIMQFCQQGRVRPDPTEIETAIRPALLNVFPPALLGRLTVVPYYPLNDEMIALIAKLQINRIVQRLATNHKVNVSVAESVYQRIAERCANVDSGGRVVHAIISQSILPPISRQLLEFTLLGQTPQALSIAVNESGFSFEFS